MILYRRIVLGIAILIAFPTVLGLASNFLVDWTWFSSVGFLGVFWTIVGAKSVLFGAVFVATATVVWVNGALASRNSSLPSDCHGVLTNDIFRDAA